MQWIQKGAIFFVVLCYNGYICDVMDRIEKILRRAFPEKKVFTEEEKEFAEGVIASYSNVVRNDRRCMSLPTRFIGIGDRVEIAGHVYRCVLRGGVRMPSEACAGCDFSRKYRNCVDLQCSRFDRRDGENVWFREVE